MENVNPPSTHNHPVLPAALRAQAIQELYKLHKILTFDDSCLESIERFLKDFANKTNETHMNDFESDDELVDTPLVSPFSQSDNDSDNEQFLMSSFTYITDFVVLEDIGEFILIDKAKVVMGKPFRKITKLEYGLR
ncbi:hypothetical protein Tco_0156324 [Tanacetum coccineum]